MPTSLLDLAALEPFWLADGWSRDDWRKFEKGLFGHLWQDYDQFTGLPAAVIDRLRAEVEGFPLQMRNQAMDADQTTKLLFGTHDGLTIESVLMRYGGQDDRAD